jgi:hypothetical protein
MAMLEDKDAMTPLKCAAIGDFRDFSSPIPLLIPRIGTGIAGLRSK